MVWLGFPLTGRRPTGVLRFGGQRGHRRSGAQMAERELQVMSRELCFYASLCRRWPMLARVCFDVHCDRFFLFSGCSRILMTSQKYAESLPTQVRVSFLSFFLLPLPLCSRPPSLIASVVFGALCLYCTCIASGVWDNAQPQMACISYPRSLDSSRLIGEVMRAGKKKICACYTCVCVHMYV